MIACGSLEFAQARVHARQGQRADDATWQRLETTRDYAALLEVARQSVLRPWLSGITSPGQVRQNRSRAARPLARRRGRGRCLDARRMAAGAELVRGVAGPAAAAASGARR